MWTNTEHDHKWGIVFGTNKPASNLRIIKINLNQSPLEIFSKLEKKYPNVYLLESIEGPQKLAQYSFIGFNPKITVQVTKGKAKITEYETKKTTTEQTQDPLRLIQKILEKDALQNT